MVMVMYTFAKKVGRLSPPPLQFRRLWKLTNNDNQYVLWRFDLYTILFTSMNGLRCAMSWQYHSETFYNDWKFLRYVCQSLILIYYDSELIQIFATNVTCSCEWNTQMRWSLLSAFCLILVTCGVIFNNRSQKREVMSIYKYMSPYFYPESSYFCDFDFLMILFYSKK